MKKNFNSTIDASLLARLPTLDQQIEKQRCIVARLKGALRWHQEGQTIESRKLEILLAKREASTSPETKGNTFKKHSCFDTKVLPSQAHLGASIGETKAAAKALEQVKASLTRFDSPLLSEAEGTEALMRSIDRCARSARKAGRAFRIDYAGGKPAGIKVLG